MSRIDDLIAEYCPGGVPWRSMGDIGKLARGHSMPKTDFRETGIGAIHYGQIYTHYGNWTTHTLSFVAVETAAKLTKVDPGDVIITNTSENLADVGKAVAWLGDHQIVTGGHASVFKHEMDAKFVAYWLQTPDFHAQKKKLASGTKVIDVSATKLANVLMPVPPMAVQREIVAILDAFQEMEAELEAELEARRDQFYWYRDEFLSSDTRFVDSWTTFGEVGEFMRGRRFTKADIVETGIPSIHYGEIYTRYGVSASDAFTQVRPELGPHLRFATAGDVVIAGVGETVQDVGKAMAWLGGHQVAVHDDCFIFRSSMNPKFVAYYMQTKRFNDAKQSIVSRAKVKRLSSDGLSRMPIPVPPRSEQDRIVDRLDTFHELVSDISTGLPAELAARRKQYEHYRDRLLTFPEAS